MMMNNYYMGLDLGQVRDHSALAVVERYESQGPWDPVAYAYRKNMILRLRYLERMELGTPYHAVVDRVIRVTRHPDLVRSCRLAIDGTGVGRPVVEAFHIKDLCCDVYPVLITAGDTEYTSHSYYHVPKKNLINCVQMMLQNGSLQISAEMPFAEALVEEFMAMEARVTPAGNTQYAVWREGKHDDLVFAVALACWDAYRCLRHHLCNWDYLLGKDQDEWEQKFKEVMNKLKSETQENPAAPRENPTEEEIRHWYRCRFLPIPPSPSPVSSE